MKAKDLKGGMEEAIDTIIRTIDSVNDLLKYTEVYATGERFKSIVHEEEEGWIARLKNEEGGVIKIKGGTLESLVANMNKEATRIKVRRIYFDSSKNEIGFIC